MDSRFCSLTACLKNAKNTKGQSAICEGLEKYKKNTKIQIAFLDVMEKYQKKYKNTKCIFLYFICIVFVFCCIFTKKIQKKYKKYECNCSKIKNTKKIRINNFKNTKYKKYTNPKLQKYKIQRKDKFKNKPESQPRVHFWKSGTKIQKIQNQPVVFSKPCSSDFVLLGCIFFVLFFCIFKYWQKTLL